MRPPAGSRDDPAGFVEHDGLMVIDEVQLAPELFRSIKVAVDTDPRPGRFLLTGSARVLGLRGLPDALPAGWRSSSCGRSPRARSTGTDFVDAAFRHGPRLNRTSTLRKRDYLDRIVRGATPRRSPGPLAGVRRSSSPTSPASSNET